MILKTNNYIAIDGSIIEQPHSGSQEWACDIETAKRIVSDLQWHDSRSLLFDFSKIECIKVVKYSPFFDEYEDSINTWEGYEAIITCNGKNQGISNYGIEILVRVTIDNTGYKWVDITSSC